MGRHKRKGRKPKEQVGKEELTEEALDAARRIYEFSKARSAESLSRNPTNRYIQGPYLIQTFCGKSVENLKNLTSEVLKKISSYPFYLCISNNFLF